MKLLSLPASLAVAALATMTGCAQHGPKPGAWRIEPVMQVRHSAHDSDAYYRTGRYFDGMQAWDRAIEAYGKSINADPKNVEAHNALGVALARRGRYEQAEGTLRHALALDPARAHVRSNLGHVLMLSGQMPQAVTELRVAVAGDTASVVAQDNLERALVRSGETKVARVDPTPSPDPVQEVASAMEVIARATVAPWPVASQAPKADPLPSEASTTALPLPTPITSRLELSNGSGERGAADRLRRWLAGHGTVTQRLTNQKPYVQKQTVIQYRPGHQADADRLAMMLPFSPKTQLAAHLAGELRVVIGHDWKQVAACLDAGCDQPVRLAEAASAR